MSSSISSPVALPCAVYKTYIDALDAKRKEENFQQRLQPVIDWLNVQLQNPSNVTRATSADDLVVVISCRIDANNRDDTAVRVHTQIELKGVDSFRYIQRAFAPYWIVSFNDDGLNYVEFKSTGMPKQDD
jgi:hypothetical protein